MSIILNVHDFFIELNNRWKIKCKIEFVFKKNNFFVNLS